MMLSSSIGSASLKTNGQRKPFPPHVDVGCPDTLHYHIPLL